MLFLLLLLLLILLLFFLRKESWNSKTSAHTAHLGWPNAIMRTHRTAHLSISLSWKLLPLQNSEVQRCWFDELNQKINNVYIIFLKKKLKDKEKKNSNPKILFKFSLWKVLSNLEKGLSFSASISQISLLLVYYCCELWPLMGFL